MNINFVATLILLVLCVVGAVFIYRKVYVEHFAIGTHVQFMKKEETAQFLKADPDSYVKNLSPLDLHARKVGNEQMYMRVAGESADDFTREQMIRYTAAAKAADAFFRKTKIHGLDMVEIANIPWVLAITSGNKYEDGLPHTRANIIFVSNEIDETPNTLTRTLVHEKMHIYQRLYPEMMTQYLESKGYKRWKQRMGEPSLRANPDVDPWIYIDPVTKEPMAAYYATDKPVSITDVMLEDAAFEHPYEKIAYEIAQRINT